MRSVALIGSPLQLVSLFEAVHAGVVPTPPTVHLRGVDSDFAGVLALGRHLVDDVVVLRANQMPNLVRAETLILGDPYSIAGQLALVASPRRDSTILLEDGAASLRSLKTIASGRPALVRAHERRSWVQPFAALARARLRMRGRDLVVVHSIDQPDSVQDALEARGVRTVRHDFAWSRTNIAGSSIARPEGRRLVLGSSLAHDGFIGSREYVTWLKSRLGESESLFRPHRRDLPSLIETIGAGGVTIVGDQYPVELVMLASPMDEVVMLPSTPALTLPRVDPAIAVRCSPVPTSWWRQGTPTAMMDLVDEIHDRHVHLSQQQ